MDIYDINKLILKRKSEGIKPTHIILDRVHYLYILNRINMYSTGVPFCKDMDIEIKSYMGLKVLKKEKCINVSENV